jgi:ABC-type transport system involved in multi-copper enzyme maturation permease subunit
MERIKLRTLRSPWVTLLITVVGVVGLSTAVGLNSKDTHGDITSNVLAGVAPGLLACGVLGVLVMTNEYSSGLIKATLAAVPHRETVLAAKTAVFGAVALVVGELASFAAFFAGTAALPGAFHTPSLSDPTVLRAVLMVGAAYPLIGLLGLGIGAIVRHGAAATGVVIGAVFVGSQALRALTPSLGAYAPIAIVSDSLSATTAAPAHGAVFPALGPWAGLGMLALYAAVAVAAGAVLLARRDA